MTRPSVLVPATMAHEDMGRAVSRFVIEMWFGATTGVPEWCEWLAGTDPKICVGIGHDPDVVILAPSETYRPATFDLRRSGVCPRDVEGARQVSVVEGDSSQVLRHALYRAMDITIAQMTDNSEIVREWVAYGAPVLVRESSRRPALV